MNAIEKRARELLADQIETVQGYALAAQELRDGVVLDGYSMLPAALSAIVAALTPPEGYVPATAVLATATRLRRLASAASPLGRKAYITAAAAIEMTVSAARPEVP